MSPDPLSDVLELVQARCSLSGRFVAGGPWARRFSNLHAIKFCAAIEGSCWCDIDGMGAPALFEAGDVLVTNGTRSLLLASDPERLATAETTPVERDSEGVYRLGTGRSFVMLGGMVHIDDRRQSLLLDGLPPMLHVKGTTPEAATIGWLLEQLTREMEHTDRPGRTVILADLAQLLFVNTLRTYLAHAPDRDAGWLKGLGDRRLACALSRMHAEPQRPWGLGDLAKAAGMSRTSFAVRFRDVMGIRRWLTSPIGACMWSSADCWRGRPSPKSRMRPATRPKAHSATRSSALWESHQGDIAKPRMRWMKHRAMTTGMRRSQAHFERPESRQLINRGCCWTSVA
jgi:hypothetical protein